MKKKTVMILAAALALAAASGQAAAAGDGTADGRAAESFSSSVSIGTSENSKTAGTAGNVEALTEDWSVMSERLDEAIQRAEGQNVNIAVGNSFEVPADILDRLAGKNAALALHTGEGVTFSVSGRDVDRTDTALRITLLSEPDIPEEARQQVLENAAVRREICMEEKYDFPCRVDMHLAFGRTNAGRHAVLYYYDEVSGSMRQAGFYRITESGMAMFGLYGGDEYIVVVMEGYTVMPGDCFSRIAAKNGVSVEALAKANPQVADIDKIRAGQMLNIPNIPDK